MFDNFSQALVELFVSSFWRTIVMVGISGFSGAFISIPLVISPRLTDQGGVLQNPGINRVVGGIVNAVRSTPFIILLVETSLREVGHGLIEAAQAMGATTRQIVLKVLPPEALPGSVAGLTGRGADFVCAGGAKPGRLGRAPAQPLLRKPV